MLGHRFAVPEQVDHDQRVVSMGDTLGNVAFAAAWAEGRAMTLEQAIDYALAVETG